MPLDLSSLSDEQLDAYRDLLSKKQIETPPQNPQVGNPKPVPPGLQGPPMSVGQRALQNLPMSAVRLAGKTLVPAMGMEPDTMAPEDDRPMLQRFTDAARSAGHTIMHPIEFFANDPAGAVSTYGGLGTMGVQGARSVVDMLPSTERAGENFQTVMRAVGQNPIDISSAGDPALRAHELRQAGATMPSVLNKFLIRTTAPTMAPMTYEEGRDFASNAGRLSAEENSRMIPPMRAQVSKFANAMNAANEKAADVGGVGPQYRSAMSEYRNAKRLEDLGDKAKDIGKKVAIGAGAGYGAYELGRKIREGISNRP